MFVPTFVPTIGDFFLVFERNVVVSDIFHFVLDHAGPDLRTVAKTAGNPSSST